MFRDNSDSCIVYLALLDYSGGGLVGTHQVFALGIGTSELYLGNGFHGIGVPNILIIIGSDSLV